MRMICEHMIRTVGKIITVAKIMPKFTSIRKASDLFLLLHNYLMMSLDNLLLVYKISHLITMIAINHNRVTQWDWRCYINTLINKHHYNISQLLPDDVAWWIGTIWTTNHIIITTILHFKVWLYSKITMIPFSLCWLHNYVLIIPRILYSRNVWRIWQIMHDSPN